MFHPLGLYLATRKPVIKLDPYTARIEDVTEYGERIYKKRLYKIIQAMDSKTWGIIVGLKTGQYRPWLIERLKKLLEEKDLKYYLLVYDRLEKDSLRALPQNIEAFIVTSCPRLPIDDLGDFEKPVLTPGEAIMALTGKLEPYRFPW